MYPDGSVISGTLTGRQGTSENISIDPAEVPPGYHTFKGRARNSEGTWSDYDELKLVLNCERQKVVVLAQGLGSSLNFERPDQFEETFGSAESGTSNIVKELVSLGYEPGATRLDPNRTLLEYSYAQTLWDVYQTDDGPVFPPTPYGSESTLLELWDRLSPPYCTSSPYVEDCFRSVDRPGAFLDALEEYDKLWFEHHGQNLEFHLVGHSEGGLEVLSVARYAAEKALTATSYQDLIGSVLTIDGAVHPLTVALTIDLRSCFDGTSYDKYAEFAVTLIKIKTHPAVWLAGKVLGGVVMAAERDTTAAEIGAITAYGATVSTITNS